MDKKTVYLGPFEVSAAIEMPYKTPGGADVVKILLVGQPAEIMPKSTFERLVSEEPVELTLLREKRYLPLLKNLSALMLEEGVKFSDLNYISKELFNKLSSSFERATSFLWTNDDAQFIPGVHELQDRTLLEAEEVLKTIKKENGGQEELGTK